MRLRRALPIVRGISIFLLCILFIYGSIYKNVNAKNALEIYVTDMDKSKTIDLETLPNMDSISMPEKAKKIFKDINNELLSINGENDYKNISNAENLLLEAQNFECPTLQEKCIENIVKIYKKNIDNYKYDKSEDNLNRLIDFVESFESN